MRQQANLSLQFKLSAITKDGIMQISLMAAELRPREKLLKLGAEALSDAELLAIFLRTGIPGMNAIELAEHVLDTHHSLNQLFSASLLEFSQVKGLGAAKYAQLQAVLELSKRFLHESCQRDTVFNSPTHVRDYLALELKSRQQEVFMVLFLDNQNRLICQKILFYGTINAAAVYPREVVKEVLKMNANAVIFAHNHPSGIAEPSQADQVITRKLTQALSLIDVAVLDHLIVGGNQVVSFAERGLL
ncbi:associated with replication fork DNA repair protein [Pseudoalteromonas tunicata D2]|uniref:Associated with replication fork DNA repair protein n=2 Tax=Pseudoalteromonas tunicata TaxID=314281 RepID=A4C8X4_9GAMM|nr:associated with replication fork DNA repair protein [Pseudoalteromonas tunicata D2]